MTDVYTEAVTDLARVPGVRAAIVVEADAGVPVVEELTEGVSGRAVAALGASIFQRASRSTGAAGLGSLRTAELQAADGHVIVVGGGEVIIVVLANGDAQLGRVRIEAENAAERLA